MKTTIAALIAAIILTVWCVVSWTVLTWHQQSMLSFTDSDAVTQVITSNADQSGIYMISSQDPSEVSTISLQQPKPKTQADKAQQPMIFAAVTLEGNGNMHRMLLMEFITQLIAAFLVISLLSKARINSYFCRIGFVVVFALAAAVACHLPYWNWWHFPTAYTLIQMADLLVGWFLASLFIAALTKPKAKS